MPPQLHVDQVFNMQISGSDAALLYMTLNFADSKPDITALLSPKSINDYAQCVTSWNKSPPHS